jgi:hypothetical protein
MTRNELDEAFLSDDEERIEEAFISSLYSEAGEWVLGWCLKFANHRSEIVRRSVALAIGTIATNSQNLPTLNSCLAVAEQLQHDVDPQVRVAAADAHEDIVHAMVLLATGTPS